MAPWTIPGLFESTIHEDEMPDLIEFDTHAIVPVRNVPWARTSAMSADDTRYLMRVAPINTVNLQKLCGIWWLDLSSQLRRIQRERAGLTKEVVYILRPKH